MKLWTALVGDYSAYVVNFNTFDVSFLSGKVAGLDYENTKSKGTKELENSQKQASKIFMFFHEMAFKNIRQKNMKRFSSCS